MIYYEIEAKTEKKDLPKGKDEELKFIERVLNEQETFNDHLPESRAVYLCKINKKKLTLVGCWESNDCKEIEKAAVSLLEEIDIPVTTVSSKEITVFRLQEYLRTASRNGYIGDDDQEMERMNIEDMKRFQGSNRLQQTICDIFSSESAALKATESLICFPEIKDEIGRILSSNPSVESTVHPVHYVIMSDDKEQIKRVRNLLLGSLILKKRLKSRRVSSIGNSLFDYAGAETVEHVFRDQRGAAVIIHPDRVSFSGGAIDSGFQTLRSFCSYVKKYHKTTLCFFELDGTDDKMLERIMLELPTIRFVVLRERAMTKEYARRYLHGLAAEDKIENDSNLMETLPKEGSMFFPSELKKIYDKWLDRHICEEVYPEYKTLCLNEDAVEKQIEGDAYSRLTEMVGLAEAKKVLKNAVDFHKAQKCYLEFGLKPKDTSKHMVFTGNPGSAKTTVARLFAEILKDNGVLKDGKFIEAGRHNIVDMYLGGTAPRVHRLFESARGGVLFIDEAYSLVDGDRGRYGDEAINAIVQEMENNRESVIVIFAGYPDKMKAFLDNNPGLRSRIAFHVNFDDYSTDELYQILQLFAKSQKMELASDVEAKVRGLFDEARTHADFGNGRFVRNVFEQAQMRQSGRIVSMKTSDLTRSMVTTLIADDFEIPREYAAKKQATIGFRG